MFEDNTACGVMFYQELFQAHFSDTFLMWTNADGEPRFPPFLDSCMNVFCEALAREIPLRGCISIGNAIMNSETGQYVGEPIRESAKGETAQKWVGVSFGVSFYRYPCYENKMFIPYEKHIKTEKQSDISLYALDWPRYWRENKSEIDIVGILKRMDNQPEFSEYYSNAFDFIMYSRDQNDWWKKANYSKDLEEVQNPFEAIAKLALNEEYCA